MWRPLLRWAPIWVDQQFIWLSSFLKMANFMQSILFQDSPLKSSNTILTFYKLCTINFYLMWSMRNWLTKSFLFGWPVIKLLVLWTFILIWSTSTLPIPMMRLWRIWNNGILLSKTMELFAATITYGKEVMELAEPSSNLLNKTGLKLITMVSSGKCIKSDGYKSI